MQALKTSVFHGCRQGIQVQLLRVPLPRGLPQGVTKFTPVVVRQVQLLAGCCSYTESLVTANPDSLPHRYVPWSIQRLNVVCHPRVRVSEVWIVSCV